MNISVEELKELIEECELNDSEKLCFYVEGEMFDNMLTVSLRITDEYGNDLITL